MTRTENVLMSTFTSGGFDMSSLSRVQKSAAAQTLKKSNDCGADAEMISSSVVLSSAVPEMRSSV